MVEQSTDLVFSSTYPRLPPCSNPGYYVCFPHELCGRTCTGMVERRKKKKKKKKGQSRRTAMAEEPIIIQQHGIRYVSALRVRYVQSSA